MGSPGIFFSKAMGMIAGENAHNDMLRAEIGGSGLRLTGWANGISQNGVKNATETEAAESLWKRFLQPLEPRNQR